MTMEDHVKATNQKLSLLNSKTRILAWHYAMGNFVVHASDPNRLKISDELSLALGTPCAILTINDLAAYVAVAKQAISPPTEPGLSWTKGVAFWVNGKPSIIPLKPTPQAVFFPINKHTVGVFKKDKLTAGEEPLDREDRAGGWSAISADINKVVGGTWTSRALKRVEGTLAKALSTGD
jgi:hypothetical protein